MHHASTARDWIDADQIARIRGGFAGIAADADRFTAAFYARLFELAPTLRDLFPPDLSAQRAKLAHMLSMLTASLDRPLELRPALAALGERHRSYGVVTTDFRSVGQALLDTLAAHLGERFTVADRAAWTVLYGRIAAIMTAPTQRAAAA